MNWVERGKGARIVFVKDGEVSVPAGKSFPIVEEDLPEFPLQAIDFASEEFTDFCVNCRTDEVPPEAIFYFAKVNGSILGMIAQAGGESFLVELYSSPLLSVPHGEATSTAAKDASQFGTQKVIERTAGGFPLGIWAGSDWFPYVFQPGEVKRLLYCIVLEPDVVDLEGDTHSTEVIEAGAHDFLANFNTNRARPSGMPGTEVGIQHLIIGIDADIVESYIAPCDLSPLEWNGAVVKKGTWIIVLRVRDDALWAKVEAGEFTGVSYGGLTRIVPLNGFKLPKK